jgi:branched-chain amino acid transport system permease protein
MLFLELLLQGLVQGGIYILVALGLTLVYGLLRILHVAHAALFTLGGYLGVLVTNATGSLALGFMVSLPAVGVVGILVYEAVYRPILHKPPFVALIASIGVFIAAEELFRILFGPYGISYAEPHLDGSVALGGGIAIRTAELATIGGASLAILLLWLLATRTRTGVAWRATVTDPTMAESFGISVRQVRYLNFFVGSALAAAAGIMVGLLNNLVEPGMGAVPAYKALAIIVLGGLGSIPGALVASVALGVIESFGTIYLSGVLDRDAIAFAFLIAVLMLRPQGLFGRG